MASPTSLVFVLPGSRRRSKRTGYQRARSLRNSVCAARAERAGHGTRRADRRATLWPDLVNTFNSVAVVSDSEPDRAGSNAAVVAQARHFAGCEGGAVPGRSSRRATRVSAIYEEMARDDEGD